MLLVIDFTDIGLDFTDTDIRINLDDDYTAAKLLDSLCDGIEEISKQPINGKNYLSLHDTKMNRIANGTKISSLALNNWDTLYIMKTR